MFSVATCSNVFLVSFLLMCCVTNFCVGYNVQAFVPSSPAALQNDIYSGVQAYYNVNPSSDSVFSSAHIYPAPTQLSSWSVGAMEGASPAAGRPIHVHAPNTPVAANAAVSAAASSSTKATTRTLRVFVSAADEQYATTSLTQIGLTINVERLVKASASNPSAGIDVYDTYSGMEHTYDEGVNMAATGTAAAGAPSRVLSNAELEAALKRASVEAQAELVQRANEVIKLINGAHVERLRTTAVGLEPIFEYPQYGPARQVGMRAKNSLNFRVNTTSAGALLSALIDAGVTHVDGISHVATDDEIQRVTMIAISNAVRKASERGKLALQESATECKDDVEIKEVVLRTPDGGSPTTSENEDSNRHIPRMMLASAARGAGVGGDLSIVGGENKIAVKATLAMECRYSA